MVRFDDGSGKSLGKKVGRGESSARRLCGDLVGLEEKQEVLVRKLGEELRTWTCGGGEGVGGVDG